ncbi:hypothetical protein MRB53_041297 [Persea americana]|nr:hypothetical protein MRB53_041297 [Persea americana]
MAGRAWRRRRSGQVMRVTEGGANSGAAFRNGPIYRAEGRHGERPRWCGLARPWNPRPGQRRPTHPASSHYGMLRGRAHGGAWAGRRGDQLLQIDLHEIHHRTPVRDRHHLRGIDCQVQRRDTPGKTRRSVSAPPDLCCTSSLIRSAMRISPSLRSETCTVGAQRAQYNPLLLSYNPLMLRRAPHPLIVRDARHVCRHVPPGACARLRSQSPIAIMYVWTHRPARRLPLLPESPCMVDDQSRRVIAAVDAEGAGCGDA